MVLRAGPSMDEEGTHLLIELLLINSREDGGLEIMNQSSGPVPASTWSGVVASLPFRLEGYMRLMSIIEALEVQSDPVKPALLPPSVLVL